MIEGNTHRNDLTRGSTADYGNKSSGARSGSNECPACSCRDCIFGCEGDDDLGHGESCCCAEGEEEEVGCGRHDGGVCGGLDEAGEML